MDASELLGVGAEPEANIGRLDRFAARASFSELCRGAIALHEFASRSDCNMYQRVRALFRAHAIYRYLLPLRRELPRIGTIPRNGQELLLRRHYAAAVDVFLEAARQGGLTDPLASALSAAYYGQAFQLLATQVQHSVRSLRGNRWMFRMGHALDHPLRIRPELLRVSGEGLFPVLVEKTPVRMDLSHSGWSDIFFLGMDYPEGARVLNVSVDLAVVERDDATAPPITCYLRIIDEPVLRLVSVDLDSSATLTEVAEVFDYGRDYLGLLKAAIIAAGIVPAALEGSHQPIALLMRQMAGPERGIELVSEVNGIPKGSRLAVSTNLLASLITICMRATGQTRSLTGPLAEGERRVVAGRAILGEWLAGSGGGWQDSGGIWPGIKLIQGEAAREGDVEWGQSRGRLLPSHTLLDREAIGAVAERSMEESLVVVHGGMSANVGPILEMVTEKYLLGGETEWRARQGLVAAFDQVVAALRAGDMRRLGRLTTEMFEGPLATIIPWVSNYYTEQLLVDARQTFGAGFWGFWMLGGMSGGGMGFIFDPAVRAQAEKRLLAIMRRRKDELAASIPFAMDPVVYRFSVNRVGTQAELRMGEEAILSPGYYLLLLPHWLREGSRTFSATRRREIDGFARRHLSGRASLDLGRRLIGRLLPATQDGKDTDSLDALLERCGFDPEAHERIRADLKAGRIGLAKNRLPADTSIEDVGEGDVIFAETIDASARARGLAAMKEGQALVVTLAAGSGSRWTSGAGTTKALYPFAKMQGRFRSFLEVHLAKSRHAGKTAGRFPPHVITTSYLTHTPIEQALARAKNHGYEGPIRLSPGRSIGLRLVPMARDLRFLWEEMTEQRLEERKQKVRDSVRAALLGWVSATGEASDYRDNVPLQCLHPVGHWYEVANLLLNGTLRALLEEHPELRYILLHNIDTLGANVDPAMLGQHVASGATLTVEVTQRRIDDRGGGLARVNGATRLVEGLALPREEDEAKLGYYNTLTTWITIDPLLALFGVTRASLGNEARVRSGVRALAARLPTYLTLKEVKRRWGNAQEDVFPVAQFEKLWGDMTALSDVKSRFLAVPRERGQQLKDVAQLDGWVRDGSMAYVEKLADFGCG
ncbi:MAG: UTP--glucose-1-phosphate uridylyltransferase [Deltaproteobacteria bacterium]|nr:UTP--glucose-1-phosphate uridylyltransferase [Deltaproteobacteria bacterium]